METKASQTDAYDLILHAIDIGTYKPGDRLVESELAERFGVSRTPIRSASTCWECTAQPMPTTPYATAIC